MQNSTPESCGISSAAIYKFIKTLNDNSLAMHDIIIARGESIVSEAYWKPFDRDFRHRQYSQTKSITALAVGFALQDGLLALDDPIEKYFPEYISDKTDYHLRTQTIRNMLMMATAFSPEGWFGARTDDRVRFYFENRNTDSVPGGTFFRYDSSGTFVIGALVEKVTEMKLMDYLRIKLFSKIGVSDSAYMLECPGGHSWSDSALICTPRDMLLIAKFVMNSGKWNGVQLLEKDFIKDATSVLIRNDYEEGIDYEGMGYGYYIWHARNRDFFFCGMGCQFSLCLPDKDMILICNADNQGRNDARRIIFDAFYELADSVCSYPLESNPQANKKLSDYCDALSLYCLENNVSNDNFSKLNKSTYRFKPNRLGLETARFEFGKDESVLYYRNGQGEKKLSFGIGKNVFSIFEQDGYSDKTGSVAGNRRYSCACSACWISPSALHIKLQIIDTYFGNADFIFGFGENTLSLIASKTAEDFLDEYYGTAFAEAIG